MSRKGLGNLETYIINILISVIFSVASIGLVKLITYLRKDTNEEIVVVPSLRFKIIFFLLTLVLNIVTAWMLTHFYIGNSVIFIINRFVILTVLWVSAYFDVKSFVIPNQIITIGLIAKVLMLGIELVFERDGLGVRFIEQLITAAVLVVVGIVFSIIMKNGIGMGDIKLFAVMGLFFGTMGSLTAIFLSLVASFFVSIAYLILKKATKKDPVPFAPCALAGTYIAVNIFGV